MSPNSLSRSFHPTPFVLTHKIHPHSQEEFAGQTIHSLQYTTAKKHLGKKAIVVGAATSGHDIAFDLADHGVGQ